MPAVRSCLSPRIGRSRDFKRPWSASTRLLAYCSVRCQAAAGTGRGRIVMPGVLPLRAYGERNQCHLPDSCGPRCTPEPACRAVADRRDRTRQSLDPSDHRRHKATSPRPYCHAQQGATQQAWGHHLRTADLRSRPANICVAVCRSHAAPTWSWPTSARPPLLGHLNRPTIRTPGAAHRRPHLTAPFHIRRSSASAMAFVTSPTTAYAHYCTATSGGRLTGPQDCEAAHHVSWRRAGWDGAR
jgi:hypothetical protein